MKNRIERTLLKAVYFGMQENKKIVEEINAIEPEERDRLSIEFFDKQENLTTKLVNNESAQIYQKSKSRDYTLYLKDPIFIQSLHFDVSGYDSHDKLEVFTENSIGKRSPKSKSEINAEKNKFTVWVNRVTSSITFRPPAKHFANPKISAIRIYGYEWKKFHQVSEKIDKLANLKKVALEEIAEERKLLDARIVEVEEATAQKEELIKESGNRRKPKVRK